MHTKSVFSARRRVPSETMNQHRTSFPKLALEVIRISDIVLEILDARFIQETRNLELEKKIIESGKKLVFVINKSDLVDIRTLKKNLDLSDIKPYVIFSCTKEIGRAKLRQRIRIEVRRFKVSHAKAHVGIIGYPNTGKSSIINFLSVRKVASTSSAAGHTKGIQKVRFNKEILILDTPGVIAEDAATRITAQGLKKESRIGIKTYDQAKEPDFIISELMKDHPNKFEKHYNIKAEGDAEILIEEIGKKHHFLSKGGKIDTMRAARLILKDWQESKIK